jgi:hypothetical protein
VTEEDAGELRWTGPTDSQHNGAHMTTTMCVLFSVSYFFVVLKTGLDAWCTILVSPDSGILGWGYVHSRFFMMVPVKLQPVASFSH